MKLSAEQQQKVREWAAAGASLNEIQDRLREDLGVSMTYMDVRLLMIDLDVTPHDPTEEEPSKPAEPVDTESEHEPEEAGLLDDEDMSGPGEVSVDLDELTIPGTVASGNVKFSDGKAAKWYLDQYGRLGLQPTENGYQPPKEDLPVFQRKLQALLSRY